jgi:hypothetical protein
VTQQSGVPASLWRKHLDEAQEYLLGSDGPVTVLDLVG